METLGKADRRALRHLAEMAYDRELATKLARLSTTFDEWRAGRLSPHAVSAAIHDFHDGAARDLYVLYSRLDAGHAVTRAVAIGLLADAELPDDLRPNLAGVVGFYRDHGVRPDT